MKYRFQILVFSLTALSTYGQDSHPMESGTVSYTSSQHIYVKFESTDQIEIGDTLFLQQGESMKAILLVSGKSSISCIGIPIGSDEIKVSDKMFARRSQIQPSNELKSDAIEETQVESADKQAVSQDEKPASFRTDQKIRANGVKKAPPTVGVDKGDTWRESLTQKITGRVSVGSYSNVSDSKATHRMRYTFSLRGDHLGNSRLSTESYITFRHTLNEWEEVKSNLSNALKVYSLALKYDFGKDLRLTLGRKINHQISSMGAVDGIQLEKTLGKVRLGAIVGSRPDYADYGLNLDLFQFGGFINYSAATKNQHHMTTLAYIEQQNDSKIDRRFIYFQHNSSLVKNLNLFTSFEIALYEKVQEEVKNTFNLTNLYASLRYRFSRRLSLSASYDTRKNLIYYESFKSFIDRLIEEESRQGVRFNLNYRPFKRVTWGINAGWRFQKSNKNLSKNLNSYLTFSPIASSDLRTTITANFLKTSYLDSKIFGIRISKEIISGKVSADLNYRNVAYQYLNNESATLQNIGGANVSVRFLKKLTFYVYYEGILDNQTGTYHRFNTKIIKRF